MGVVVLTFAAASCKKEYVCDCTWEEEHDDHHHDEKESFSLGKVKKDDASAACDAKKASITADPDAKDVTCKTVSK